MEEVCLEICVHHSWFQIPITMLSLQNIRHVQAYSEKETILRTVLRWSNSCYPHPSISLITSSLARLVWFSGFSESFCNRLTFFFTVIPVPLTLTPLNCLSPFYSCTNSLANLYSWNQSYTLPYALRALHLNSSFPNRPTTSLLSP